MSDALLLAVDGGNSKTDVVLLQTDGSVVAAVRGAGSNPHHLGLDAALDLIAELIDAAWARAAPGTAGRPRARAAAFMLAGADQPDEVEQLRQAIGARAWAEHVVVDNDTLALLLAGSRSGHGVAVVVGAGVNGIGVSASGREARFAALGEITGDHGGGSGIGMAALGAAVRGEDGRTPPTMLSTLIAAHFGEPSATAVAVAVHRERIPWHRLVELPRLVFDAARAGDGEAIALVDRQADEVVSFATAALRRTGQEDAAVQVVLGGSVMTAAPPRMIDRIRAGLATAAPGVEPVLWEGRPVVGAAIAALNLAGGDDAARATVRATLLEKSIAPLSGPAGEAGR